MTLLEFHKAKKYYREIAKKHKLPLVHLVESAGVNLMAYSVELWSRAGGLFGGENW